MVPTTPSSSLHFTWVTESIGQGKTHPPVLSMELEPNLGAELDISAKLALATPNTALYCFYLEIMDWLRDFPFQKVLSYCILISAPAPCSGLQGDSRDSSWPLSVHHTPKLCRDPQTQLQQNENKKGRGMNSLSFFIVVALDYQQ
jgi:hypothetical protein